ncbi:hypothetical protein M3231_14010 [Neobacillus mesonae]|nr:hypothetical protein [Neobacillus mesonae]
MNNNEIKLAEWRQQLDQLIKNGEITDQASKWAAEVLHELELTQGQNERLRKVILKQSSNSSKMNSKLRDALME